MTPGWTIGIIGGSGLYAIDALEDAEWRSIETPWGTPSDDILFGRVRRCRAALPAAPRARA